MKRSPQLIFWFLIFFFLVSFYKPAVVTGGLNDSKFPQLSRTFLSTQVDLNSDAIRTVSIHPPISTSSSLFSKPFRIVLRTPAIIIGITMFYIALVTLFLSLDIFSAFHFPLLSLWPIETVKSTSWQALFFFLFTNTKSSLLGLLS